MNVPTIALLLCVITLCACQPKPIDETRVTFSSNGQEVVGTLVVPDGEPAPVVLLFHGFTGHRDEVATKYVEAGILGFTAQMLARAGFSSLRIDFRGSGESTADLSFSQTTFEGQVNDGLAAIDFVRSLDNVAGDKVRLIGISQGGLVATAVAGRAKLQDAVALWNPVSDPEGTYGGLFGHETLIKGILADSNAEVSVTTVYGKQLTLNGAFFHDLSRFDPLREIRSFSGPLLVVQGVYDEVVAPEDAEKLIASHEGVNTLLKLKMGHAFNVYSESKALKKTVSKTIDFFEAH